MRVLLDECVPRQLAGSDRFKGTGVLCPWRARTSSHALAPASGSPAAYARSVRLRQAEAEQMTVARLLVIPEERKQQEIRRAMARADSESTFGRRAQWLAILCAGGILL